MVCVYFIHNLLKVLQLVFIFHKAKKKKKEEDYKEIPVIFFALLKI